MKKLFLLVLVISLSAAIAKANNGTNAPVKPYPLDHCIVCGMLVKGRTDAYSFVYKGQEIKLCDQSEKEEFDKNPEKYLKKIAKEVAKQKQNSNDQ
jgi:YHS domain-containing protein